MNTFFLTLLARWQQIISQLTGHRYAPCYARVLPALLLVAGASTSGLGQTLTTSITYPQFNSSYLSGTSIDIQATATTPPGTTITKVEFFYDKSFSGTYTKIGEALTAPYSVTWTAPAETAGRSYQIRAIVTNSASATAVNNPPTNYNGISIYPATNAGPRGYYVSAAASATNTAGTEASPFNTIQKAADRVAPGDVVYVMAGNYTGTGSDIVAIRRTGTASQPIVFKPYQTDKPKLVMGNNNWNAINILPAAAYLTIQGFEVLGNNGNVTLDQAKQQPGACEGPTPTATPTAKFNGNGISVAGSGGSINRPHHITIAGNYVHDCGGGGISAIQSDYVTIEDNITANNSWYTVYGTSGISILNSWNYDNSPATKIIIRRNRSFGNRLKIAWNIGGTGTNCKFYDGNGIILDNNRANNPDSPGTIKNALGDYLGAFLIENNIAYLNGGRGININYSDNATILNNTTYQNGQSDGVFGVGIDNEFIMQGSIGARIYNNIFSGKPGELPSSVSGSRNVSQNNNLTFSDFNNGYFTGNQNIVGKDPQFVDAANGDFRLVGTSPAINAGSSAAGQYALKDVLGVDRPQGAGVDMGAYEFQGIPVAITQQPASSSTVCAGSTVTVSVSASGTVQSYQWYKDGSALTGVASATTATLTLTGVTTAQQGSYSVIITGFTNQTSAAFGLTVTALPQPPTLLTQTGQPYPGGVASLTISQNTGPVTLVASGCAGGTLSWDGGSATTLAVSTANVGSMTYAATCRQNGCTSPAATATVTVVPTTLGVSHLDATGGQLTTNVIKPYLLLTNAGATPIPYSEITVRYWLTAENFTPLTNLSLYYTPLGANAVHMRYVAADQPRQGAMGYVEYSFDAAAGSLPAAGNSGPVQSGIAKQDYSNFDQADDYSYVLNRDFTPNAHITAYRNGTLFWGVEPSPVAAVQALKVYAQNNNGPASNGISTILKVSNEGTLPVAYQAMTIRYYFTADGPQPLNLAFNTVELGSSNITGRFVNLNPARVNADTYLEFSFSPGLDRLYPGGNTGSIAYQITKSDYSYFDMSNDYSYQGTGSLVENGKITAYINGSLVYGQEPAVPANTRLGVAENQSALRVTILGNPTPGDVVHVGVSGTEGQPLRLVLTDIQGRIVAEQQTERAGVADTYTLPVGRTAAGVLLLRVSTLTESRTLKVMKP